MKKKLFIFTAVLMIFNAGSVYAATNEVVLKEEIQVVDKVDFELLENDIDDLIKQLEEDETKIKENKEIQNEELDKAINEVLTLDETLESEQNMRYNRIGNVSNIVERQYFMKKQFIINTNELYNLTIEMRKGLENTKLELKDIIRDKDRTIDEQAYKEIRRNINELKMDLKENTYIVGNVGRESINYIRLVSRGEFRKAANTFEQIVLLQDERINLLTTINKSIDDLNTILGNI